MKHKLNREIKPPKNCKSSKSKIDKGVLRTKLSEPAAAFDRQAQIFRKEWVATKRDGFGGARGKVTLDALKTRAYKLITEAVLARNEQIFEELIEDYGCRQGASNIGEQEMKLGLRALLPGKELDRRRRLEWGNEFQYAFQHFVEPELLCSFLRGAGSRITIQKKLAENHIEPGFRPRDHRIFNADGSVWRTMRTYGLSNSNQL